MCFESKKKKKKLINSHTRYCFTSKNTRVRNRILLQQLYYTSFNMKRKTPSTKKVLLIYTLVWHVHNWWLLSQGLITTPRDRQWLGTNLLLHLCTLLVYQLGTAEACNGNCSRLSTMLRSLLHWDLSLCSLINTDVFAFFYMHTSS